MGTGGSKSVGHTLRDVHATILEVDDDLTDCQAPGMQILPPAHPVLAATSHAQGIGTRTAPLRLFAMWGQTHVCGGSDGS
jgi:hypothetical protein